MFISDELIYVQMQKTGCSHIAEVLGDLFDGEIVGKHQPATPDQRSSGRYIISSIRDPWDWYLSLWTFGVSTRGGLRHKLTQNRQWRATARQLLMHPVDHRAAAWAEFTRGPNAWAALYQDADDVRAFRLWLNRVLDPSNRLLLGEGYAANTASDVCGFMTHRYLRLCCAELSDLGSVGRTLDYADVVRFDRENCYVDAFVRQEDLEHSLIEVLKSVRPLTNEERASIFSRSRTNASARPKVLGDYYDGTSTDLVLERDRLIVEKFGYRPPI